MNQEIKKRWVEALRSGDYEQGEFRLCYLDKNQEKKYCCLGVLCDLATKELKNLSVTEEDDIASYNTRVYQYGGKQGEVSLLPFEVMEWAGLDTSDPQVKIKTEKGEEYFEDLTRINDDYGYNFNQLADLIEAQL